MYKYKYNDIHVEHLLIYLVWYYTTKLIYTKKKLYALRLILFEPLLIIYTSIYI